ncbi:MAG TPA: class I SAM-dependent methyltransferase [Rudaea sp.]|nr:class I SAM-dependent methyltransferase [Rudaea sp.]
MTDFKDHFSGHADVYRQARPTYPPELFRWLAQQSPDATLAWDCGCGNGQATLALAEHFDHVTGTDPSAQQIARAQPRNNVDYRVEPAEQSSFGAASVSLICVAQALHWFDHDRFHAEARRVLKPHGVFAAWSYSDCATGDTTIDRIKDRLYIDLTGPYWPPERAHVDAGYRTLAFPYAEITTPPFVMAAQWNVDQLLAYLRSWSATQRYIKANGEDPVALIEPDLRVVWGDPASARDVHWQFHLRAGRV